MVLALIPFATLHKASETVQHSDGRRSSHRHHGHNERTPVRNSQPYNRRLSRLRGTALLVLSYIREYVNLRSTKVLEVMEIPGAQLRVIIEGHLGNPSKCVEF